LLSPEIVRFCGFELDLRTEELRRSGRPVKLPPQALRLLKFLTSHPGQLLTREAIQQEIWSAGTFVDFEHGINKSIRQIRDALDDDADHPRFVETVPRRGYRFIAQLDLPEPAPTAAVPGETGLPAPISEPQSAETPVSVPKPAHLTGRLLLAGTLSLLCIWLLAFNAGGWRNRLLLQTRSKAIESLAVLPFESLSNDHEQDYFAEGLTDEMITSLAKISALRVISRTSVMRFKGTKEPLSQVARELNVDAVLEGTVMRDHDRVRITAQLIAAAPEKHLWAEKYEGNLSEVLTLQGEVAKAVAQEIRIKLTPGEQTLLRTPRNIAPEAREAYWKGRYLWEQSGEVNLTKSRAYFEKAINTDPGYASAWAGLADAYQRLADWGAMPRQEAGPRGRAAAEKALQLDGSLVEPVVAIANVKMQYEWDWAGAERLFRQAIGLSPNYGHAHHNYALYLALTGRSQDSVREAQRAHEIEPHSGIYAVGVIWFYYLAHQYEQAEAEYEKERALIPNFYRGYILGSVFLKTGRQQEAVAELRKGAASPYHGILELMYLAHALGVSGARAEGQKVLDEMLRLSKSRYVPPEFIALVYEGLGERDKALQWFEKAFSERSMHAWILADPRLDQIRTEARFRDLMRRMGLPG
jgi:TolB-like protein/DNA-binding winged helix-turn-helix (wHTH) protein/Tfp pilus assembly protein PilF